MMTPLGLLSLSCSWRQRPWLIVALIAVVHSWSCCRNNHLFAAASYAHTTSSTSSPELNRQSIAGLWRLTTTVSNYALDRSFAVQYPMKEFTTYPKKPLMSNREVWLWLNEDGSFQQFQQDDDEADDDEQEEDGNERDYNDDANRRRRASIAAAASLLSWNKDSKNQYRVKGTWDFRDGKLILATDRPNHNSPSHNHRIPSSSSSRMVTNTNKNTAFDNTGGVVRMLDTILVGRLVATQELGLVDNPVILEKRQQQQQQANNSNDNDNVTATNVVDNDNKTTAAVSESSSSTSAIDTRLSVPKGSVKIGKFVYPKHHPSFFDQPLMRPTAMGSFQLRQVMGTLNTQTDSSDTGGIAFPKFDCQDFYNKRFLLTSHPIERKLKGKTRWSIKYNKFVEDIPKSAQDQWEEEQNRPVNIRVMEVQFFANRTFATVAGLGSSTILRGKYDVIGTDSDHLWMQVWRFGFGRSVSGSVYSEGPGLTQDDAKSYWGQISYQEEENDDEEEEATNKNKSKETGGNDKTIFDEKRDTASQDPKPKRLQVQGSVLFGFGLEPLPIGRFIMREITAEEDSLVEDDDDEDYEDDDEENDDEGSDQGDNDAFNWSNSFQ